jgi:hypothetical protein
MGHASCQGIQGITRAEPGIDLVAGADQQVAVIVGRDSDEDARAAARQPVGRQTGMLSASR